MVLRSRACFDRVAAPITAGLRRPQRGAATTARTNDRTIARTSGGTIMNPASIVEKRNYAIARWTAMAACVLVLVCTASGQERKLTLQEAIDLAKRQNHGLKAASFGVAAEQQKRRIAESNYFPSITNESSLLHITDLQRVEVPP